MKKRIKYSSAVLLFILSSLSVADGYVNNILISSISLYGGSGAAAAKIFVSGTNPAGCYLNQLALLDLTDVFQKEAYATLLTAKINGLLVKQVQYTIVDSACQITNIWIGS